MRQKMAGAKKANVSLDQAVSEYLQGDKLKNFLELNDFLKSNQLSVTKPAKILKNSWAIKYKGKKIAAFKIWQKDGWFFSIVTYKQFIETEAFEKYITAKQRKYLLSNIRTTLFCPGCKGRKNVEFLGKVFDTVCGCWPHYQWNPDGEALEYAKQFILINKSIVSDIAMAEKTNK